jgi:response regulator RpfG family c-di-GMP phosphodiesterase
MKPLNILVVDDDVVPCGLVRNACELEGIDVDTAHHVVQAERVLLDRTPDAILLDIGLPGIDGLFYCTRLRENPATSVIPILATSNSGTAGESALAAGASAFLHKPFDLLELLTTIGSTIGIRPLARAFAADLPDEVATKHLARLLELIELRRRRHEALDRTFRESLAGLATLLEIRGLETSAHTERVAAYAMQLTIDVAPSLSDDAGLQWGFVLHDVGKIGLPDRLVLEHGPLQADESRALEEHTTIGEQLLADVPLLHGEGLRVVRSHHERWDGTGYPDGLAGREIPIGARILSVADRLDTLTNRRPRRRPLRWDAAIARIREAAGKQFDPDVVDALIACERDLLEIRSRFHDAKPTRTRPQKPVPIWTGSRVVPVAD